MAVTAASRPFQVAFAVWLWLCLTWGASGLLKEEAHTVSIPPAPAVGLSIGSGRPSVGTEFCLRNHVGVDIVDTAAVIKDEFDWDNDMRYRPEKNFVHLTIPSKKQECRHMENYRFANGWPWTLTMFFRGGGKATLTVDQNDAVRGRVKRLEIDSDVPDLIAMQTVDTSDERLVIDLFSERDGPGLAAGQVNSTILNGKGSGQGSRRAAFLPRSSP